MLTMREEIADFLHGKHTKLRFVLTVSLLEALGQHGSRLGAILGPITQQVARMIHVYPPIAIV